MVPPTGKASGRSRPGRSRPRKAKEPSSEPDVFQQMLAEAGATSQASASEDGRTVKKRRVGGRLMLSGGTHESREPETRAGVVGNQSSLGKQQPPTLKQQQTIYDDDEDSGESDEDDDWEDVNLAAPGEEARDKPQRNIGDLNLDFAVDDPGLDRPPIQRRKPLTAAERKLRLEVHKMHILTLLSHVHLKNHWCNDLEVQASLRELLPNSVVNYLEDHETQSQFQRSRSLTEGLEKASEIFRQHFEITARGMTRNYWAEDAGQLAEFPVPEDIDLPVRRDDFRDLAKSLSASRDIGAQLFCALLRAIDLEVRLVCSLQPLSFTSTMKGGTPAKPAPVMTVAVPETRAGMTHSEDDIESEGVTSRHNSPDPNSYSSPHAVPKPIRRFGRAGFESKPPPGPKVAATPSKPKKKRIRESLYPIFWVEVFSPSLVKWLPVDPLVTRTVAKPSKFEPPASDPENNMSYVIAFEEDGHAKDVTRRYTKAYNAKTRRSRVDGTKGGDKWWKRVMRMYRTSFQLDRDQIENGELAKKEAQEPMPKNIQEFKTHPYYALERHLRRNEVLHPKRQIGKVSAGTNKPLEPIYRRSDVHQVRSTENWFRLGREVKAGEKPLKILEPGRKKTGRGPARDEVDDPFAAHDDDDGPNERPGQPMFAAFQTQQYVPPPVSNGRVPRNLYGNIDVYTNSMVPPGGVWIAHPFAAGAAKLLGVDYADAVTGFEFKGRTGTAVVKGVVVAGEYHEAVSEAIKGFQYAIEEEEVTRRSEMALRAWKKFLTGLRIRQRIVSYADDAGAGSSSGGSEYAAEEESEGDDEGGGFLPDRDAAEATEMPQPDQDMQPIGDLDDAAPISKALLDAREPIVSTWGKILPSEEEMEIKDVEVPLETEEAAGGFLVQDGSADVAGAGGFLPDAEAYGGGAGGFLLENNDASNDDADGAGGGFIVEAEEEEEPAAPHTQHKTPPQDIRTKATAEGSATEKRCLEPELSKDFPLSVGSSNTGTTGVAVRFPSNDAENAEHATTSPAGDTAADTDADALAIGGASAAFIAPASDTDGAAASAAAAIDRTLAESDEAQAEAADYAAQESADDAAETSSLLSHDPEDEDATPEWLA